MLSANYLVFIMLATTTVVPFEPLQHRTTNKDITTELSMWLQIQKYISFLLGLCVGTAPSKLWGPLRVNKETMSKTWKGKNYETAFRLSSCLSANNSCYHVTFSAACNRPCLSYFSFSFVFCFCPAPAPNGFVAAICHIRWIWQAITGNWFLKFIPDLTNISW